MNITGEPAGQVHDLKLELDIVINDTDGAYIRCMQLIGLGDSISLLMYNSELSM